MLNGNIQIYSQDYDKLIASCPFWSSNYHGKGVELHQEHRFEEAIEQFDQAIRLNPNVLEYYFHKGESLEMINKKQEAFDCFEKALTFDHASTEQLNIKIQILLKFNRFYEAMVCSRQKIIIFNNHPTTQNFLLKSETLSKLNCKREAIIVLNYFFKLNPYSWQGKQRRSTIMSEL